MTLPSDEIIIGFSDLKRLFYRTLPHIKRVSFIAACAVFVFFLFKEPLFIVGATFKQVGGSRTPGSYLKELFQGVGGLSHQDPTGSALMTSQSVLRDAVEELGLQVQWDHQGRIMGFFSRIWENISLEIGSKIPDMERFVFQKVHYDLETGKNVFIKVLEDGWFKLFDEKHNELGKWRLNEPITLPFFSGCLIKIPSQVKPQKFYRLRLAPWTDLVGSVRKRFVVKQVKAETSVYLLTFADRDRHLAADLLNQVMASYCKLIYSENEEIAEAQVAYLEKRQDELARKWDGSLQEHVAYLKNNLHEGGYLSFSQELDYLQEPQHALTSRLLDLDFKLNRFESKEPEEQKTDRRDGFSDFLFPSFQLKPIGNKEGPLAEMQQKQLGHKLLNLEQQENKFTDIPECAMAGEIKILSQQQDQAARLLEQLEEAEDTSGPMLNDPQTLVAIWAKQLTEQQQLSSIQNPIPKEKQQLKAYIAQVGNKIKVLEDNLSLQCSKEHEFTGLTLETAQQLYLDYNSQRDSLQVQLKQLVHLAEQLYQPEFELSSITTILADPVTQGLVFQAGETAVRLQDASNRSLREQERLRETLRTQKSFIAEHLLQIIELTKLRVKLAEDKIRSLRTTTSDLLKREKHLVQDQLAQLNHQMEHLPEKWRRENLLLLKKELGMKMVQGLTELMESKSIEQHLYYVGSRPIDRAFAPLSPKKPRLLLYALMGGLLGGLGSYSFAFFRSLMRGLSLSHESLTRLGFYSCGPLSEDCDAPIDQLSNPDLETVRRLCQFLLNLNQKHRCCAVIGGKAPNFVLALAGLLQMRQSRVLVVQYVFDKPVSSGDIPGLWHYLQGEVSDLPIRKLPACDFLPSGGTSRHAVEMLGNPRMGSFLASVKERYDFVLLYSSAESSDVEAQALLNIVDAAIVAVKEETREELAMYQSRSVGSEEKQVAFVSLC